MNNIEQLLSAVRHKNITLQVLEAENVIYRKDYIHKMFYSAFEESRSVMPSCIVMAERFGPAGFAEALKAKTDYAYHRAKSMLYIKK